jgi:hypothetical protein
LNLPPNITLQKISKIVAEGPLYSIRFGVNPDDGSRYVGLIFMAAADAAEFHRVLEEQKASRAPNTKRWIFSGYPDVVAVRGDPHPADSSIRAMMKPPMARRRLTLVKKGLFNIWGQKDIEKLCEQHVGAENVQVVFVYNGGNATIVFNDVGSAEKMKAVLESLARNIRSIFVELVVSYSKDPCEAEMRLVDGSRFHGA